PRGPECGAKSAAPGRDGALCSCAFGPPVPPIDRDTMTDAPQRTQDRKSVALLVQLKHPDVGTFAEQWATNLSPGGMFIRTRKPQAVGTRLRFEVKIAGGVRVMRGLAEVRWVRHEGDPAGPPGMGLSFSGLDPTTQQLVDRMLKSSPRGAEGAEEPPSATPAPSPGLTPVAP